MREGRGHEGKNTRGGETLTSNERRYGSFFFFFFGVIVIICLAEHVCCGLVGEYSNEFK